jgi:PPP family 3-phenylpropionic acid transporter
MIFVAVAIASAAYTPLMPLADTYALRGLGARGRAYGPVRLWGSAAFIAGTFAAGAAADMVPARQLIWLIVAACALYAFASLALEPLEPAPPHAPDAAGRRTSLLRNPAFLTMLAAASLIQSSHAVYYAFSTLSWSRSGLDGTAIAALWALGVVAEIVLFAVSARLPPAFTPSVLLIVGAGGAVLRWSAMAFDPPVAALPWLQLLHGLSFGATHLGALGFLVRHAPPGQGASAQGTLSIVLGLATALVTGLSGLLFAAYGSLAYAAMALAAVAGGACGLVAHRLDRDALRR